ncbi:hypothetical protein CV102_12205 [Natronococcus pandeyae]|uniref:Uncharacterized protein n=1 Tax=Natronococcus pandeyae TaxID=2055836 RepID=A0A8J8Q1T4_9EURY|nr:hypothetical protein [Natronococcus pandeyae]TYL38555.1 hypothetical protein CV102_12205 [Natronococcus pandeyae]
MSNHNRRSLIAGGTSLITVGALASLTTVGARDDDSAEGELELSISAPDSVPVREGYADFLVTVTNHGDDPVSVPVVLEIAHIYDELETLELAPGESGNAYTSIEARSLGSGEHDWTVTADGEVETGTVTVESHEEYDEDREDLELTVHLLDGATARIQDGETTTRIGCDLTVFNHDDDPVSADGSFEIAGEREPISVELDGRESEYISTTVELERGEHEWTATIGDETETGTLVVIC